MEKALEGSNTGFNLLPKQRSVLIGHKLSELHYADNIVSSVYRRDYIQWLADTCGS